MAFEKAAHAAGLYAKSINGDAFSDAIKQQAIALIKADLGQVDGVIYSLASPRRTHPRTGVDAQFHAQADRRALHREDRQYRQGRGARHHARSRPASRRSPIPSR